MLTISSEQTKGTQKKNIDLYAKTFGLHYWNEIWSIRKSHHNESNVFLSFNVLLAVFSREYIAMYQRHTHSKHNTRHRAHSFNKLNAKCQTLNHKRCFKREHKGLSHRTLDLVTLVQMNDKNDDERRTEKKSEWVQCTAEKKNWHNRFGSLRLYNRVVWPLQKGTMPSLFDNQREHEIKCDVNTSDSFCCCFCCCIHCCDCCCCFLDSDQII